MQRIEIFVYSFCTAKLISGIGAIILYFFRELTIKKILILWIISFIISFVFFWFFLAYLWKKNMLNSYFSII